MDTLGKKRPYKILKDILRYANKPYLLLYAIIGISTMPLLYNLYIAFLQYSLTNSITNDTALDRWIIKVLSFVGILLATEIINRSLRYYISSQKNYISSYIKEKVFDISINKADSQLVDKDSLTILTKYSMDMVDFIDVYIRYIGRLISGCVGLIYAAIYVDLRFFFIIGIYALLTGCLSILKRDSKTLSNNYYSSMEKSEHAMQKMLKSYNMIKSLKIEDNVMGYVEEKLTLTENKEKKMINYENDRETFKRMIDLSSVLVLIVSLAYLKLNQKAALRLISMIWLINPIYNFIPNCVMLKEMGIRYIRIIDRVNLYISKNKSIKDIEVAMESKYLIEQNNIYLENVSFYFNDKVIMGEITLQLEEGDFCLIKGLSGSGKTTLLKLIMGIHKPSKGQILIGGAEPDLYSGSYSYVDQEAFLFPGSIRDNLSAKNTDISDEEIWAILSSLDIYDRISSLGGLDTIVENHDTRLSGGERQRLCIARAILKPSYILFLDEATSGLDKVNRTRVYETIERYRSKGRIIIEVAHNFDSNRYNKVIDLSPLDQ